MNVRGIKACFKAYDIRGKVPDELDAELCFYLGRALADEFALGPAANSRVVIGRDVRPSGVELSRALAGALLQAGVEVADIGVCGTEEIYFAAGRHAFDLGIMFTASHNPAEYNGIKLVKAGAAPISGDSGLFSLRDRILNNCGQAAADLVPERARVSAGSVTQSYRNEYIALLLSNFSKEFTQKPLKVVMNPGNGCAGYVLHELLPHIPAEFVMVHGEPDGSFPNGVPNPLLPERRAATAQAVRAARADLGLAWDGDFDRCFFYDGEGNFVESYYLIGLLAQDLLRRNPGAAVLHDTRLFWNTDEMVRQAGGVPIMGKTGHAFMKERMRRENAVYGGEMSAHHYFRDFYYCDSGMLPWLLLLNIIAQSGKSLAELVAERIKAYPCSGEINFTVHDAAKVTALAYERFRAEIQAEDHIDGLSADCGRWRFNLRSSNTEPLLRLNVEARGDASLMQDKTAELSELITASSGV